MDGHPLREGSIFSCNAPIRIATENTVWCMNETNFGHFNDCGASFFLPRVSIDSSVGLYLALTSKELKGKEMVTWGIATHFLTPN